MRTSCSTLLHSTLKCFLLMISWEAILIAMQSELESVCPGRNEHPRVLLFNGAEKKRKEQRMRRKVSNGKSHNGFSSSRRSKQCSRNSAHSHFLSGHVSNSTFFSHCKLSKCHGNRVCLGVVHKIRYLWGWARGKESLKEGIA